ncbi:MAG: leucine-rich repeat domain-containing protein [Limisphaerales bacterium]
MNVRRMARTVSLLTTCVYGAAMVLMTLPTVVQAQFTFTTNNDAITITKYTGSGGAVTIPSTTNGYPVTSIGGSGIGGAFQFCLSLTSVTIPSSVTSLTNNAFTECNNLRGVFFQGNAPQIGLTPFGDDTVATVYYFAGTTGWGTTFGSRPALLWDPQVPYTYTTNNGTITITGYIAGYTNSSVAVTAIPSAINGLPVTTIGLQALFGCASPIITIPNSITSIGMQAFLSCSNLTSITIPGTVTNIGISAFWDCSGLTAVYFEGNAPSISISPFGPNYPPTVYYLPGTTGWLTFANSAGCRVLPWNPQVQTSDGSFGVQTNQFGFNITWASGMVVVVEACTDLANPIWSPVGTNTLTNGSSYFSDPQWTNYPARLYRVRWP